MILKGIGKVTEIYRKSTNEVFKNLQIGDEILFSTSLAASGRNGNRTYAKYVYCTNIRTGKDACLSFNQLEHVLECCKLKQIE